MQFLAQPRPGHWVPMVIFAYGFVFWTAKVLAEFYWHVTGRVDATVYS